MYAGACEMIGVLMFLLDPTNKVKETGKEQGTTNKKINKTNNKTNNRNNKIK